MAGTSHGQGSRGLKRNLSGPIKWDAIEEDEDPDAQPVDDQEMQGLTEEEVRTQHKWQELSEAQLAASTAIVPTVSRTDACLLCMPAGYLSACPLLQVLRAPSLRPVTSLHPLH